MDKKKIYGQLDQFVEKIQAETGSKSVMIFVGNETMPQVVDGVIAGVEERDMTSFFLTEMRNAPGVKFMSESGGLVVNDPKMFGKDGWSIMADGREDLHAFKGEKESDKSIPVFQLRSAAEAVAKLVGVTRVVPVKIVVDMDKKVDIIKPAGVPSPYSGIIPEK